MNSTQMLSWLAGTSEGWVTVTHARLTGLRCMLCEGPVTNASMWNHGLGHLATAGASCESLSVGFALLLSERECEATKDSRILRDVFAKATEEVFGFRPGTPASLQFWKDHGGS